MTTFHFWILYMLICYSIANTTRINGEFIFAFLWSMLAFVALILAILEKIA